jgi:hypothetical protein
MHEMPENESSKSWDRLEASLLGSKPKTNNTAPSKNINVNALKVGSIALATKTSEGLLAQRSGKHGDRSAV